MGLLIKENNIKKVIENLDKEKTITSVAGDVAIELEKKIEDIISSGIKRAKANNRRTLLGRDLWNEKETLSLHPFRNFNNYCNFFYSFINSKFPS